MSIEYRTSGLFKFFKSTAAKTKAKTSTNKLCNCQGSEPGKIKIDVDKHLRTCRFQKRTQSREYGTKESVVPNEISGGYGLGLALREEYF